MKKKGIIILCIAAVLIGVVFFFRTPIISFFSDYTKNFKQNISIIAELLDIKLPESCQGSSGSMNEEDLPLTEYEKLQIETEKQKEIDNSEYQETNVDHTGKNIALEYASSGRFARYDGGVLCVTDTTLACYSKDGEKLWSEPIQISSPVLDVSAGYALIYEKNGSRLTVYHNGKFAFSKTVKGNIKTGAVSAAGDVSIVFERDEYKGSVMVLNKKGEEVYLWNSGKYGVIDADMSQSRKLAVSLLDTEDTVSSKIYFFDISKSEVKDKLDVKNSVIFDIDFDGEILNAYADDRIIGVSTKASIKWEYELKDRNIVRYAMTDGGTKVIVFDDDNTSEIMLISAAGDEKDKIKSDVLTDIIDIYDNRVLYNDGRTLVVSDLGGEVLSKYVCSRDIKRAYIIDKNHILIVYSSSIEFLSVEGE